jgi:histidinol-phosphate aminotransferase
VRNVSHYPGLAGCLRLSIGTPEQNDLLLAALSDLVQVNP